MCICGVLCCHSIENINPCHPLIDIYYNNTTILLTFQEFLWELQDIGLFQKQHWQRKRKLFWQFTSKSVEHAGLPWLVSQFGLVTCCRIAVVQGHISRSFSRLHDRSLFHSLVSIDSPIFFVFTITSDSAKTTNVTIATT